MRAMHAVQRFITPRSVWVLHAPILVPRYKSFLYHPQTAHAGRHRLQQLVEALKTQCTNLPSTPSMSSLQRCLSNTGGQGHLPSKRESLQVTACLAAVLCYSMRTCDSHAPPPPTFPLPHLSTCEGVNMQGGTQKPPSTRILPSSPPACQQCRSA